MSTGISGARRRESPPIPAETRAVERGGRTEFPRRAGPVDEARRTPPSPSFDGREGDGYERRTTATDTARAERMLDAHRAAGAKGGAAGAKDGAAAPPTAATPDGAPRPRPVTPITAAHVPDAEALGTRVSEHLGGAGGREMARALEASAPGFGVPAGGFSGQTNLYGESDGPVAWYALRGELGVAGERGHVSERAVGRLEDNLSRAAMVTDDPALAMAVTMREHPSAWTAHSGRVETFSEGGLDFMGDHLGDLARRVPPEARTGAWRRGEALVSGETGEEVHPASIPAADQLVAYAGELERSEEHFESLVREVYGDRADEALGSLTEDDRRAWTQFTFGRPGRTHAADHEISDRGFSANAALELLHSEGTTDLGAILDDPRFAANASVRRARTTALEARWIEEHLLAEGGAER